MKNIIKITRLLLLFALCNHAFSQEKMETVTLKKQRTSTLSNTGITPVYRKPHTKPSYTRMGAPLFSEDFSGGIMPEWQIIDVKGSGKVWEWNLGQSKGNYPSELDAGSANSTSGNGYVMFDSDGSNASIGGEEADLITPAINCIGKTNVRLKFNEYFRQYAASTGRVYVSNNGTTWDTIVHEAQTGLTQNQGTANPWAQDIDISTIAANKATVYIKFKYTGDYDYYWFLDDIQVVESNPYDASVSAIISPVAGCGLTNLENVSVSINNKGAFSITAFDVAYSINGNAPVIENVGGLTLAPGETQNFSFSTPADLSQLAQYTISAFTQLTGDGDNTNDTSKTSVNDYLTETGDTLYNNFEGTEPLKGWKIEDTDGDTRTWFIGDMGGNNVEAIFGSNSATTADWLFSNCMELVVNKNYRFSFRDLESPGGNFSMEVYYGTAQNSTAMSYQLGILNSLSPDNTFYIAVFDFTVPVSGVYYFGIYGYAPVQSSTNQYIVIDEVKCNEVMFNDAGATVINAPFTGSCGLSTTEKVTARIVNFGITDISNFPVSYQINSGTPVTEIIDSVIKGGEEAQYTFSTTTDLSAPGNYTIKVYTSIAGEENPANDTVTRNAVSLSPYSITPANPYLTGFEPTENTYGWKSEDVNNDGNSWRWMNTYARTGTYCMRYIPTDTITPANDWFISPCLDLKAGKNYRLSFFYKTFDPANPNKLKVMMGTSNQAADMTIEFIDLGVVSDSAYKDVNIDFNVVADGVYYIGFNVYSDANMSSLRLDDISISETIIVPPIADFYSVTNNVCTGDFVYFDNLSSNNPTSYQWFFPGGNPASSTQQYPQVTYSTPGQYDVTLIATNAMGSDTLTKVNYININGFSVSSTATPSLCAGGGSGTASVSVSGGASPFSYAWNNGATTAINSNLIAGNYVVTVTDAKGCKNTSGASVTEPTTLFLSITSTNILCNGGSSGNATATVTGGTTPYSYSWSNGTTGNLNLNLSAGSYLFTVTDKNSCTATVSTTLNQPPAISASLFPANPTCPGMTDGSIQAVVSGGVPPYNYIWSNAASTPTINGLTDGSYQLTVTDFNNCNFTASVDLQGGNAMNITFNTIDLLCAGNTNGAVDMVVSGGNSPYTYQWSNGQVKEDINNLSAGIYTCTITDSKGCSTQSQASVSEPAALILSITQFNTSSCGTSDGQASVNATGGVSPYTYIWSTGAVVKSISNLAAGSYIVTVSDNNSCTKVATASVSDPGAQTVTLSATHVFCNGGTDGTISTNVSGGTPPYTFVWSNGATNQDLLNLPGGNYAVTVEDATGCLVSNNMDVINPSAVVVNLFTNQSNCAGENAGGIIAMVNGGTIPYSYLWSNSAITSMVNNLSPGLYSLTVTDANGCQKLSSAPLSEPAPLGITLNKIDINCAGSSTGSAIVSVSGGIIPYSYSWSNGSLGNSADLLTAGTYNVTVTDSKGCTIMQSAIITEPVLLSITSSSVNLLCAGANSGSATVTVSGGALPYNYNWTNGFTGNQNNNLSAGSYQCTVTDFNGCVKTSQFNITEPMALSLTVNSTNPTSCGLANGMASANPVGGTGTYTYLWSNGNTSQFHNNLLAGTYTVTITDANVCTKSASVSISDPGSPTVSLTVTNVTCNGGTDGNINTSISGGTMPYAFSWLPGGSTNQNLINIGGGNYSLVVTDATGCKVSANANVLSPAAITLDFTIISPVCSGDDNGSVSVTISGGNAPYSYNWSTGAVNNNISNISAGNYTLTVTDSKGCTGTNAVNVTEPAALSLSLLNTNIDCFGNNSGTTDAQVSGGTVPYNYAWSNGSIFPSQAGLSGGIYSLTVTDKMGCSVESSLNITAPSQLILEVQIFDILCSGAGEGSADLTVSGGTQGYAIQWSNGAVTEDLAMVTAGNYFCTVTDANGCVVMTAITITEPSSLSVTLNSFSPSSCGNSDGSVSSLLMGGISPYTYSWNTGDSVNQITGLTPGIYTLNVVDKNGCVVAESVSVTDPGAPVVSAGVTDVTCFGSGDGSVIASASGGISPYTYVWSTGNTNPEVSDLIAGTYFLTVTDSTGCKTSIIAEIMSPEPILFSFVVDSVVVGGDGAIDLTVSGGTVPYLYNWSTGEITEDISGLNAGDYTVLVRDMNNCTDSVTINVPLKTFINFAETSSAIHIYPNPFEKELWYRLQGNKNSDTYFLTVYNEQGKPVINIPVSSASGKLNISNLPSGIYLFELKDKGGRTTRWKAMKGK